MEQKEQTDQKHIRTSTPVNRFESCLESDMTKIYKNAKAQMVI